MGTGHFLAMLHERWSQGKFVCVGLDSEFEKIPAVAKKDLSNNPLTSWQATVEFNCAIVEATKDLVCAYKPNMAFYEERGYGMLALRQTIEEIHEIAPDVPVILDFKRGDIGNTNMGYVREAFDRFNADAVTISPYLGEEAMRPFLERKEKGIFVLCCTSNPGAGEFQDLRVTPPGREPCKLYEHVAHQVAHGDWNKQGNCGVVAGATDPKRLGQVRRIVGDHFPLLIPGVGAQGGDVEQAVLNGKDRHGKGMIINSSRGIIFASNGADYAEAARRETEKLHNLITQALNSNTRKAVTS